MRAANHYTGVPVPAVSDRAGPRTIRPGPSPAPPARRWYSSIYPATVRLPTRSATSSLTPGPMVEHSDTLVM